MEITEPILSVGDLMYLRKPAGSIYKITSIHEYWILNGSETLTTRPADTTGYTFSRIYHYVLYSNVSGKIIKASESSYCKESLVVPFSKAALVEKLNEKLKKATYKEVEKIKEQIKLIHKNLWKLVKSQSLFYFKINFLQTLYCYNLTK